MISIFDLINTYQDGIIASITFLLGTIETGVCSWAIHRLIMDEQFLIFIIGHAMYKKTKNLQEAMSHYASLREYLQSDLFEIIHIMKAALSLTLVAGICLTLASMGMMALGAKPYGRKLWIVISTISLLGLVGGFGLALKYLVQNILYMQIFLATTGITAFLLLHLLLSVFIQEVWTLFTRKPGETNSTSTATSTTAMVDAGMEAKPEVSNSEAQTPSIALYIQEEFPLTVPPPSPPTELANAPSTSTSTRRAPTATSSINSTA